MPAEAPGVMTGGVRAVVVEALVDLVLAVLDDEERARPIVASGNTHMKRPRTPGSAGARTTRRT